MSSLGSWKDTVSLLTDALRRRAARARAIIGAAVEELRANIRRRRSAWEEPHAEGHILRRHPSRFWLRPGELAVESSRRGSHLPGAERHRAPAPERHHHRRDMG